MMNIKKKYGNHLYTKEIHSFEDLASGHNGPYYDEETLSRLYAHNIFELSYYYRKTKNQRYYNHIVEYAESLISKKLRPMNKMFYCRKKPHKDLSNGVIGQAWVIEALVEAYKITDREKYVETAIDVFNLHPFDNNRGLWKIVNVDGSYRTFDMTFNHQLWFAASGVQILSTVFDENVKKTCDKFLESIEKNNRIYSNGLIKHSLLNKSIKNYVFKLFRLKSDFMNLIKGKTIKYKENGYHLFNLYAFALIKKYGYELDYFQTKKFKKQIKYAFSDKLYKWLTVSKFDKDINVMSNIKHKEVNIYGFPYNAPGFELPMIYQQFSHIIGDKEDYVNKVIDKQIELTYDKNKKGFFKNTEDPETLNARFYELVRALD